MRKNRLYLFLLGIGISGMLGVQILSTFSGRDLAQIAAQATVTIADKSGRNLNLANEALNDSLQTKTKWEALFDSEKTGLYLFENDSLVYWNNSQWEMNETPPYFKNAEGLAKLKHGYFLYTKVVLNKKTTLVLSLVKPNYELQNNYLDNSFSEWTKIPKEVEIDFLAEKKNAVLFGNEILFGIKGSEPVYFNTKTDIASGGIFTVFFLLILITLLLLIRSGVSGVTFGAILFGVIALRAAMVFWHVPEFLNRTALFDPHLFGNAQSFMNGFLGDILFNALVFLFIATAFHFYFNLRERSSAIAQNVILLFVLLFVLFNQFNANLVSLVNNSTFDFNFLSIFSIKPIVFVSLAGCCVLLLAVFISIHNLTVILKNQSNGSVIFVLLVLGICLLEHLSTSATHLIESYWLLPAGILIYFTLSANRNSIALSLGAYILLMSVVSSALINFY
ncbi:MAG: hypothetical protein IT236_08405, partial [Bacteroidia bacterium]|nr:hypothetical protein [Bacteroidia bacterium]